MAVVHQSNPRSCTTFYFYLDPINDDGPGCYLQLTSNTVLDQNRADKPAPHVCENAAYPRFGAY